MTSYIDLSNRTLNYLCTLEGFGLGRAISVSSLNTEIFCYNLESLYKRFPWFADRGQIYNLDETEVQIIQTLQRIITTQAC